MTWLPLSFLWVTLRKKEMALLPPAGLMSHFLSSTVSRCIHRHYFYLCKRTKSSSGSTAEQCSLSWSQEAVWLPLVWRTVRKNHLQSSQGFSSSFCLLPLGANHTGRRSARLDPRSRDCADTPKPLWSSGLWITPTWSFSHERKSKLSL